VTDESALLAAICAAPEDDSPRLVYADWLEENGKAERAELIRVQCALAAVSGADPRRVDLEVRAEELLVAHEQEWRNEVPTWVRDAARFQRGFVTQIRAGTRSFLSKGGGPLKRAPITDVRLGKVGAQLPALAACRHLTSIRDLHLEDVAIAVLAPLADSPHLEKLRGLHLEGFFDYPRTVEQLEPLLAAPSFRPLAAFSLHALQIHDPAHLDRLLSFPAIAQLEYLKFYNNVIDDRGAERLAQTPSLAGLRELDLCGSWNLTDEGLRALATSPYLANLERLGLGGARGVTDAGLKSLAESPYLRRLTDLSLEFTGVSDAGIETLVSASRLPNLSRVGVFHVRVDELRWKAWRSFRPPNLYVRCIWIRDHRQSGAGRRSSRKAQKKR
jgi:uncharacterized protein (TIGR02996 family)